MCRIFVILCVTALASVASAKEANNVIFVIADGMGPAYLAGLRYYADDPATANVESTILDQLWLGAASTYPAGGGGVITDSAAAATALSSGVKTYNGAIAVNSERQPVATMLEIAKRKGMKTGVAVTSQINHATPAAFIAHNESRENYNAIADAYFDDRIDGAFKADVMLGGGWQYFKRPDRNLIEEFVGAGYQYVADLNSLAEAPVGKPLLGLFADVGLPWAMDYPNRQRLPQLTQAAVKHLQNKKGFFLMVEASQVDWAGHANDIAAAMGEMADLAATLEWLTEFVRNDKNTLLVITADHSTGGLSLGSEEQYLWRPNLIHQMRAAPETLAKEMVALSATERANFVQAELGLKLTAENKSALASGIDADGLVVVLKRIIDQATHTGWTTAGHTGVDVPVLAIGPGAEQFAGFQDNTDIAKKLIKVIER